MYQSYDQLLKETHDVFTITPTAIAINNKAKLQATIIDILIMTAVFSPDQSLRQKTREIIKQLAKKQGIFPASIYSLYQAIGEKKLAGFTVPAINIRMLTYDTARLLFRLAKEKNIGAWVFEIARSEMIYTAQRPDEYAACIFAAAIKEGYHGPVFLQGDHFQLNAKKYKENPQDEIDAIKNLIKEAIAAGFYNIDIDASTLVDLTKEDLSAQQETNYEITSLLTNYIRLLQPKDVMIAIGGEIGHIGGRNSTVADFTAFMDGYNARIASHGIGKVSVQTGTSHGGIPLLDGSIANVALDLDVLRDIGEIARTKYLLGGAVQHGASTLPNALFHEFVRVKTLEIHLATGFQNIVFDTMPPVLRDEIYAWVTENESGTREQGWSDEQFLYKTRKKAIGQFKQKLWELSIAEKKPIQQMLLSQLTFLFQELGMCDTKEAMTPYLPQ